MSKILMSNKDYHAHEAIGSSKLKKIALKSILHASVEKEETDALILGKGLHALLLEPETFNKEFVVAPKVNRATKEGKETWAKFEAEAGERTLLKEDQKEKIDFMLGSILAHPIAKNMLKDGEAEYSYFCQDELTGYPLKTRPDYVHKNCLIDIKTCSDASVDGFIRSCGAMGYHIQAAFYLDVYNKANGTDFKDFFCIAVENKEPYAVNIFQMGEVEISLGREQYKKALLDLKKYNLREEGVSIRNFGYENTIKKLEYPTWLLIKNEVVSEVSSL